MITFSPDNVQRNSFLNFSTLCISFKRPRHFDSQTNIKKIFRCGHLSVDRTTRSKWKLTFWYSDSALFGHLLSSRGAAHPTPSSIISHLHYNPVCCAVLHVFHLLAETLMWRKTASSSVTKSLLQITTENCFQVHYILVYLFLLHEILSNRKLTWLSTHLMHLFSRDKNNKNRNK